MSSFSSKIESIRNLWFEPMPATPINVVKAVRTYETSAVLGADGKIYSNCIVKRVCYGNTAGRHIDLFHCCRKLGVLSAKVIKEHLDQQATAAKRRERSWAAAQLRDTAKTLGVALSPQQKRVIKAANPMPPFN